MELVPVYLYGVNRVPKVGDGALFHFTKFESLLKILENMTLRSSPLSKMNDLNEADLSGLDWNHGFLKMYNAQDYVRNQCSILSFAQNYEVRSCCREGSNHPALWAHYADDSKGACIVLDKDAFLKINQKLLENVFYRLEDVKYTWNHGPDLKMCNNKFSSPSEFIKKYYREVFFKKDVDWSNEGEIRLLLETPQIYLNIKGAIKHIVLGNRLIADESNMRKLLSLILSSDLRNYFSLHSFAYVQSSLGGYITEDASHHIQIYLDEIIKEGEEATYFIEK